MNETLQQRVKRLWAEFDVAQEEARRNASAGNLVAASQAYSRVVAAEREWIARGRP